MCCIFWRRLCANALSSLLFDAFCILLDNDLIYCSLLVSTGFYFDYVSNCIVVISLSCWTLPSLLQALNSQHILELYLLRWIRFWNHIYAVWKFSKILWNFLCWIGITYPWNFLTPRWICFIFQLWWCFKFTGTWMILLVLIPALTFVSLKRLLLGLYVLIVARCATLIRGSVLVTIATLELVEFCYVKPCFTWSIILSEWIIWPMILEVKLYLPDLAMNWTSVYPIGCKIE